MAQDIGPQIVGAVCSIISSIACFTAVSFYHLTLFSSHSPRLTFLVSLFSSPSSRLPLSSLFNIIFVLFQFHLHIITLNTQGSHIVCIQEEIKSSFSTGTRPVYVSSSRSLILSPPLILAPSFIPSSPFLPYLLLTHFLTSSSPYSLSPRIFFSRLYQV